MKSKWNDDVIIKELDSIINCIGKFPRMKTLQTIKRYDLHCAITKNGGINKYRKIMNYDTKRRNPNGYWTKKQAINVLKTMIKNLNDFPSINYIKKNNGGLYQYIIKNKKLKEIRCELKFDLKEQPKGFWLNWENVKKCIIEEFEPFIKLNIFPTQKMLANSKYGSSLPVSIMKYHNGSKSVAKKLNCIIKNKYISPDNHCVDSSYELLLDWYLWTRNIKHDVHGLISKSHLYKYDFKIPNFYIEIWGYMGKDKRHIQYIKNRKIKENLYKSLGFKLISIEKNVFNKSLKNIEFYFDELFKKYGFNTKIKNKNYISTKKTMKNVMKIL